MLQNGAVNDFPGLLLRKAAQQPRHPEVGDRCAKNAVHARQKGEHAGAEVQIRLRFAHLFQAHAGAQALNQYLIFGLQGSAHLGKADARSHLA